MLLIFLWFFFFFFASPARRLGLSCEKKKKPQTQEQQWAENLEGVRRVSSGVTHLSNAERRETPRLCFAYRRIVMSWLLGSDASCRTLPRVLRTRVKSAPHSSGETKCAAMSKHWMSLLKTAGCLPERIRQQKRRSEVRTSVYVSP